jgi:hypothetical protein
VRPYLKNNESKRVGDVTQVAKHLPSKCKALSSNSSSVFKNQLFTPRLLFNAIEQVWWR